MSTSTQSPARQRIRGWSIAGAWVLGLIGIAQLIAWGNRWYVASMFARSASEDGAWQYTYHVLDRAHQALVTGLVLLILAAALAWYAARARRR